MAAFVSDVAVAVAIWTNDDPASVGPAAPYRNPDTMPTLRASA